MEIQLTRGGLPPVRWSAIAAGVSLALALHVCLGLFGAALGFAAESGGSRSLGLLAALWTLFSAFVATTVGALFTARLADADDPRRALPHGILVWALALVVGVLFLSGTLAGGAMGASYLWNGGAVASDAGRDTGPGSPLGSAAGDAARASLLGGFASLAGLGGALFGAMLGARAVSGRSTGRPAGAEASAEAATSRAATYAPGMMPPPPERRREAGTGTVWSDPAFDRRRSTTIDRRRH